MQIRIKKRYYTLVLSLFMSTIMSGVISFVVTISALGFIENFFFHWLGAWGKSWITAFPIVQVVFPLVRRLIDRLFVFY